MGKFTIINYKKGMKQMTEMIKQYRYEAKRLKDHAEKLKKEIETTKSYEIIKRLRGRILLLERERFEILRDIRAMEEWIK